jgi:hypothetical protein
MRASRDPGGVSERFNVGALSRTPQQVSTFARVRRSQRAHALRRMITADHQFRCYDQLQPANGFVSMAVVPNPSGGRSGPSPVTKMKAAWRGVSDHVGPLPAPLSLPAARQRTRSSRSASTLPRPCRPLRQPRRRPLPAGHDVEHHQGSSSTKRNPLPTRIGRRPPGLLPSNARVAALASGNFSGARENPSRAGSGRVISQVTPSAA